MKTVSVLTFVMLGAAIFGCGDRKAENADVAPDTETDTVDDISADVVAPDTMDEDIAVPDTGDDASPSDVEPDATSPDAAEDVTMADTGEDAATGDDTSMPVDVGPADDTTSPPTESCNVHGDCTPCTFPTAPLTTDDCYCRNCDTVVLTTATCIANAEAWTAVCGEWEPESGPCAQPRCVPPTPAACINAVCIDACDQTACPDLACPPEERATLPGECCPRCVGDNSCTSDDACVLCVHGSAPAAASECDCPLCPRYPMLASTCEANARAYDSQCGPEFQEQCPIPICMPAMPPFCGASGLCEAETFRCREDADCMRCPFGAAPIDASDCACEGCGVPMPAAKCEAIMNAVGSVCAGYDFDACLPPPCPAPPPLACDTFSGQCILNTEF